MPAITPVVILRRSAGDRYSLMFWEQRVPRAAWRLVGVALAILLQ
jgi:hypothetical protein